MRLDPLSLVRRMAAIGTLLLLPSPVLTAATLTSPTANYSDVSATIAFSANGDTINVPAGNVNWGMQGITVPTGRSVIGAGTNSTIITSGGFNTSGPTDAFTRISGFQFIMPSNPANDNSALILRGSGCNGSGTALTQVRIDHCYFRGGKRMINLIGRVEGVIDHCAFNGCSIAYGVNGDDKAAWARSSPLLVWACLHGY